MVEESQPEIGRTVVSNIQDHFFVRQLQTRICAGAELASNPSEEDPKQCNLSMIHKEKMCYLLLFSVQDSIITLVHIGKMMRECQAPLLRIGLSHWLTGVTSQPCIDVSVRDAILKLLEVAHGDLAVETMRLLEVMVDEPYDTALSSLIFSHLPPHKVLAIMSRETGMEFYA